MLGAREAEAAALARAEAAELADQQKSQENEQLRVKYAKYKEKAKEAGCEVSSDEESEV